MKSLQTYINESQTNNVTVIFEKNNIKANISKNYKELLDIAEDIYKENINFVYDDLTEQVNTFFDENRRKRKMQMKLHNIEVGVNYLDIDNKKEFKKLGKLFNEFGILDSAVASSKSISTIANISIEYNGKVYGKSSPWSVEIEKSSWKEADPKWKSKYNKGYMTDKDFEYSNNGYNDLPFEISKKYSEMSANCIDSFNVKMIKDNNYEKYYIYFYPVFNKEKLNKIYNDLDKDKSMQHYRDSMTSINKGIEDYYASKKSGDYTGD